VKDRARGGKIGGAIFPNKNAQRYQGLVSATGAGGIEAARERLARLVGRKAREVGDGDVLEALGRGWPAVEEYLTNRHD
jgi:hypothetical protein